MFGFLTFKRNSWIYLFGKQGIIAVIRHVCYLMNKLNIAKQVQSRQFTLNNSHNSE